MTKTTASPPSISIPLPLPVHFGLLPSRAPGQNLAPVLYSLINDIPVYLTLSPSHQPHFSLLPLLLSLKPPIPPLHILTALRLTPRDYSIDLDGTAPYPDLWVPWLIARQICDRLGVSKLFRDEHDAEKGLLSRAIKDAVSWDEGGTFGHNWLPPTGQLPVSSYSLAALLDTPFSGVQLIPGDRCTFTPIDPGRRASIIASAEARDHSRVRRGRWGDSWESLLRWTVLAWEEYLLYPSKPPKNRRRPFDPIDLPSVIHHLLPALASGADTPPTFTPALNDLRALLDLPLANKPNLSLFEMIHSFRSTIAPYVPFIHRPPAGLSPKRAKQLALHARVNLGLVESLSLLLMRTWNTERERHRLEKLLEGRDIPAPIVIDCRTLDAEEDRLGSPHTEQEQRKTERRASGLSRVRDWRRQDSMENLRRARGGSPVSSIGSDTPLEPEGSRRPPTPPSSSDEPRMAATAASRGPTRSASSRSQTRRANDTILGDDDNMQMASPGDVGRMIAEDVTTPVRELMLLSERREGWWMYLSIIGATIIALLWA